MTRDEDVLEAVAREPPHWRLWCSGATAGLMIGGPPGAIGVALLVGGMGLGHSFSPIEIGALLLGQFVVMVLFDRRVGDRVDLLALRLWTTPAERYEVLEAGDGA